MSFLGGAECSFAHNPLRQFSKHIHDGQSMSKDRLVAKSADPISQAFRHVDFRAQMELEKSFNDANNTIPLLPMQRDDQPNMILDPSSFHIPLRATERHWIKEYQLQNIHDPFNIVQNPPQPDFNKAEYSAFHNPYTARNNIAPRPVVYNIRNQISNGSRDIIGIPHANTVMVFDLSSTKALDHQTAEANSILEGNWEAMFSDIDATFLESGPPGSVEKGESIAEVVKAVVKVASQEDEAWRRFDEPDPRLGFTVPNENKPGFSFTPANPFLDHHDSFEIGMRMVKNGDNLAVTILAFEAACQQNPNHVEAWRMLGSTHADNANELLATEALQEALRLDPDNLDVLMGLAVSFTNNGYDAKSYEALERWITTKYGDILDLSLQVEEGNFSSRFAQLTYVKELFLTAARLSPQGEEIDINVQIGLSILCFSSESYRMAADCFATALEARPPCMQNNQTDPHLLWNRLGAALANMGSYDEAIEAYEMALVVNPHFVRAHQNLSVLYYNIRRFMPALKHILEALQAHQGRSTRTNDDPIRGTQEHGQTNSSNSKSHQAELYSTLRRVLQQLGRWDLKDSVGPGMNISRYKIEFNM